MLISTGILASATGNVITGVGTTNPATGADSPGADGGKITQPVGATTDSGGSDGFSVNGALGTLVMDQFGNYTYTRNTTSSGTDNFTYTLTDGDGDSTTATLTINLDAQSTPVDVSGTFSGTVEEEQLQPASATSGSFAITASGNEDTDDATNVLDNDTSPGGFSNITNVQVGAFTVTGGDLTYVFKLAAGLEGTQVQKTAGGGLTSGGQNVLYHEVTPDHLIGYVENGAPGSGFKLGVDRVIFALDITGTGSYTFTLYDRVDHPNATSGGPTTEENISINLNNVVLVDDENGETALVQGSIAIIDDTPLVNVGLSTQLGAQHIALELDETVQPDGASNPSFDHYNGAETESTPTVGSNGGSDDVAPGAPNVYNHVPVVSTAPLANQAIGSKTTAAGSIHDMFTGFTPLFGADGPHAGGDSVTYGLKFTLAGNVATNLVATDTGDALLSALSDAARHIHLVQVSNTVIEGRLDGADGIGGSTADEYVAFRMTLNNPSDPAIATIKVDQFLAIDHDLSEDAGNQAPESPSLFDENVVMKLVQGGSLGLELDATAKDGDSDIATSSATLKSCQLLDLHHLVRRRWADRSGTYGHDRRGPGRGSRRRAHYRYVGQHGPGRQRQWRQRSRWSGRLCLATGYGQGSRSGTVQQRRRSLGVYRRLQQRRDVP